MVSQKVKQLFRLKDKNPHTACKIYEGICLCGANYIGKTISVMSKRGGTNTNI